MSVSLCAARKMGVVIGDACFSCDKGNDLGVCEDEEEEEDVEGREAGILLFPDQISSISPIKHPSKA